MNFFYKYRYVWQIFLLKVGSDISWKLKKKFLTTTQLLEIFIQDFFFNSPLPPAFIFIYQHLFKIFLLFQTTLTTTDLLKSFLSTFIQKFFLFQTTLTTTDLLKSFYQHLFKNFFINSTLPSLPLTC